MEGKILGVTVELDHLTNPDVAKSYEDGIEIVMQQMHDALSATSGSVGMQMQCQAVFDILSNLFGKDKAVEIVGDEKTINLFRCLDAFDEIVNLYPNQIEPILDERVEKYDRSRIEGR